MDLQKIEKLKSLAKRLCVSHNTLTAWKKKWVPKKYTKALIEVIKERQKELDEFILLLENNEK